jgi:hypothetical protein
VGQYERLVLMAEDELTQYSTDARKIEKLRQKIGLSVNAADQRQVKEALQAELPEGGIAKIVENQRQTVALPFWGIAGLGLLLGISFWRPLAALPLLISCKSGVGISKLNGWCSKHWKILRSAPANRATPDFGGRFYRK